MRAKMLAKYARKKGDKEPSDPGIKELGDLITADHVISKSDIDVGVGNMKCGLLVLDHAVDYMDVFPAESPWMQGLGNSKFPSSPLHPLFRTLICLIFRTSFQWHLPEAVLRRHPFLLSHESMLS